MALLSYLLKHIMHLNGELVWRCHIGLQIWCTCWILPPEINKNIWSSLFLKKLFLFSRELAYVRMNISSNTWNGYTSEIQEKRLFFNETAFLFLVSCTVTTWKFQLLYFRNETCYGNGNLYKDLHFVCLQPSVNKKFVKPHDFDFTINFDDVTVKTI